MMARLLVWVASVAAASAAVLPSRLSHVRMCSAELQFDGNHRHEVQSLLSRLPASSKIPGVYSITDAAGETQFVGTSRNVGLSLRAHVATMPERVASVQLLSFASPDRKAMETTKREWIRKLGRTPHGNGAGAESWAEAVRSIVFAPISPTLRPSRVAGAAMNETPVSSPFEAAGDAQTATAPAAPAATAAGASFLDFTAANVDRVLEEVRPYLISDGGNVAVVSLDETTRNVYLKLEGACGSCPSSTVTMKMGIERVLREKFSSLGQVVAVEADDEDEPGGAGGELTVAVANTALEQIMPAILGLGGNIEVISAAAGTVTLRYEGPEKIKFGVELALRDNPLIQKVEFF
jgi:Fe-S cluster biogenesis protein NfuA